MKKEIFLGFLFVVIIVVLTSIAQMYAPHLSPYSSKSRESEGSLALYSLLSKYTTVERIETDLREVAPGTLLVVGPVRLPSLREEEYLFQWVEEGNRLIVLSDSPGVMKIFGATLTSCGATYAFLPPQRVHWSTENVRTIGVGYHSYFSSYTGSTLFKDGDRPLIVEVERGKGEIFLVSTTSLMENSNIGLGDNGVFLVQLSLSDHVSFDEYHLYELKAERGIGGSVKSILGYTSLLFQSVVVLVLFFVSYGKRFGTARPRLPRVVQSSELVVSAADLYYKVRRKEILNNIGKEKGE